jgi:hypothetical protein
MISFSIKFPSCKARVDFQIPGSHDNKIILHFVIHQPRRLFNSLDLEIIFSSVFPRESVIFVSSFFIPEIFHFVFDSLNSTNEFHSLQKEHCPVHFTLSFQQLLQIYIVFRLKYI